MVFGHAQSLKDSLVRAKFPKIKTDVAEGCLRCGKSLCQVAALCQRIAVLHVSFLAESIR